MLVYLVDNVLMFVNIWNILVVQRRYRTIPLLFLYIYSFITLVFREAYFVWEFEEASAFFALLDISTFAKLLVGVI